MRDITDLHEDNQEPIGQIVQGADGHPLQTIPVVVMLDRAGNDMDILSWTGRTPTPKSVEAGRAQIIRNVRENGYVPRWMCPLTREFGEPLVVGQPDEKPCAKVDAAEGCKHYQAEKARRRQIHIANEASTAEAFLSPTQALLRLGENVEKWARGQQGVVAPDDGAAPRGKGARG